MGHHAPAAPFTRRPIVWLTALAAAGAIAAVPLVARHNGEPSSAPGTFQRAAVIDLEVAINKDGELQAVNFLEIYNKSGNSTQILELVKEGTRVKKGDVLCALDSQIVQQRLDETNQELRTAQSLLIISKEMLEIQKSQNQSNVRAAETTLRLAKLEHKLYEDGTYPQLLENAVTAVEMANLDLKNKEEELALSRRLFGQGFVTAAEIKKGEMAARTAQNEVRKAQSALTVLKKFTYEMDMAKLNTAVVQAEQNLERVLKENASMLAQRVADVHEKEEELEEETGQHKRFTDQLAACTIKAPEDGIVIYATSVDRSAREPIQPGTIVRDRQLILTLPDVRKMKAVLQLSEAQRARIDTGKPLRATVKILGVPDRIGATLTYVSVMPDSSQRFWNPDTKDYTVDLTLDHTPPSLQPGIRIDATILLDRIPRALVVPVSTVYAAGNDTYVFVREFEGSTQALPRKVTLGPSNATHIQITSGLSEGEEVLPLAPGQGRSLLESAGIRVAPTQPAQPPSTTAPARPLPTPPPDQRDDAKESPESDRDSDRDRRPDDDRKRDSERNPDRKPAKTKSVA